MFPLGGHLQLLQNAHAAGNVFDAISVAHAAIAHGRLGVLQWLRAV